MFDYVCRTHHEGYTHNVTTRARGPKEELRTKCSMSSMNGEVASSKWIMDKDTLGCSGQRDSWDLGELASDDSFGMGMFTDLTSHCYS